MKFLLGLGVGVGVGAYVAYRNPELYEKAELKIKEYWTARNKMTVGEESQDIQTFQVILNELYPELELNENGFYSEEMKQKITPIMAAVPSVYDTATGAVDPYFMQNFNYILGVKFGIEDLLPPEAKNTDPRTIQKGDNSKDVERLQELLIWSGVELSEDNIGAYTTETAKAAFDTFKNSTVLLNEDTSGLDADFIANMYNLINQ